MSCFGQNAGELTSRSTRGDDGTVKAGLGDNIDLDGGVTTRVVDGAGVNLSDRHLGCLKEGEYR